MISLIITCFNSKKHINECIESILKSRNIDFEVIIVDDGSTDGSREILKKLNNTKNLSVNFLDKNHGATGSRNIGARQAKGEYLVFLDIDTRLETNSVEELIKPMQQNEKIGMTQPLLLKSDNSIESAGHFLSPFGFPYNLYDFPKDTDLISTLGTRSALAIKKDIFEQIGRYDEDYLIYGEDTDLAWRTWLAGYEVKTALKSRIKHLQRSSMNKQTNFRIYYEGSKNLINVLLKNLPLSKLCWLIPLNIFVWKLISFKLIITGQFDMAFWIYRGIWWNIIHFGKTLEKRKKIKKHKLSNKILFGEITLRDIINKGISWIKKF